MPVVLDADALTSFAAAREALRQAVPMVARQELPASVVERLEQRVSGLAALSVIQAAPAVPPQVQIPTQRYATFANGRTYLAFVYGRRTESMGWVAGAPFNGVAVDEVLALNESPLRRLEPGEKVPAGVAIDLLCPISGARTEWQDTGEPLAETTPAAEISGQVVVFRDGAHIVDYEQQLIYSEAGTGPPARFTGILPAAPTPSVGQVHVLFIPMTFADQVAIPTTEATA